MIIEELRQKTYDEMKSILHNYGRCALIRCTGFGKTWMLSKLIGEYNKVLYLYPSKVVADTVEGRLKVIESDDDARNTFVDASEEFTPYLDRVKFMTYSKLIRLSEEQLKEFKEYDLIIADECHRLGAKNTRVSMHALLNACEDTHFVGATATPDRGDAVDVIDEFFGEVGVVSEYTIHNAFQDGILKKPYYCFCAFDIVDTIRGDLKKEALFTDDTAITEVIDKNIIEIGNIFNMNKIIRKICNQYAQDTSYMKFIVFFSNFKHIEEKGSSVHSWFKHAYPKHSIEELVITSEKSETRKNVDKLNGLTYRKNHIDLIYCVDMLNMGYHVSDLTGIVMYRGTESGILYTQQLGRALSTGNDYSSIVFDVVDNLHRKAVYELYDKSEAVDANGNRIFVKKNRPYGISDDDAQVSLSIDSENSKLSADVTSSYEEPKKKWWKGANNIKVEDLIAVDYMASYKALIAKLVAEPKVQRSRLAFEGYFRRWCIDNGIDYPMGHTQFEDMVKKNDELFQKYVQEMCIKYKVTYPISKDWIMKELPSGLNIEHYAKFRNVSVKDVLEDMKIA